MKKLYILLATLLTLALLTSCQAVSKKIDEKTTEEEAQLSSWINKPESELKINFGKPDRIDFKNNSRNRYYVYIKEKIKTKCERKFEINPNNMVVRFSSRNCF